MTQEEQQQINAAMQYLERQIANVAREGANATMIAEALGIENKKLKDELAALKEPKPGEQSNVTPIGKKATKRRGRPPAVPEPETAGDAA